MTEYTGGNPMPNERRKPRSIFLFRIAAVILILSLYAYTLDTKRQYFSLVYDDGFYFLCVSITLFIAAFVRRSKEKKEGELASKCQLPNNKPPK
jgi:hypothetical protein